MVDRAESWRWSSAASHVASERVTGDPLTDVGGLGRHVRNWPALLRHRLEASDLSGEGESVAKAIEMRLSTGRPLAADAWIEAQELAINRPLARHKPGPKARKGDQLD